MAFNPAQLTLASLPSVRLDERRNLPEYQGIYFATIPDGTILYIGKTRNLLGRWKTHHRLAELLGRGNVSLSWLRFDGDDALLSEIERACVEYFAPVLNRAAVLPSASGKVKRTFAFPPALLERLEEIAKRERRTLSAQIEYFLELALAEYDV